MSDELISTRLPSLIAHFQEKPIVKQILDRLRVELPQALNYHSVDHTIDVLQEALFLGAQDNRTERELELIAIAAAFHDAGYLERPTNNEQIGARMAADAMSKLGDYSADEIEQVRRMILDTKLLEADTGDTRVANAELSKYLLDADLCNFGRDDFFDKLDLVLRERNVPSSELYWKTLETMRHHLWLSMPAQQFRQEKKEANMRQLAAMLAAESEEQVSRDRRMVAFIQVNQPDTPSQTIHLYDDSTLRIGRSKDNEVVLLHPNISRYHAVISASSSGVLLSDLASLNGTYVNEIRVSTPVTLRSGDSIRIGDAQLKIALGDERVGARDLESSSTIASQLVAVYVTVLITDVCGYTRLLNALPAQDVAQALRVWLDRVAEIVSKFGGTVDKFIGDGMMALWHGRDNAACAKAALNAAMAIQQQTAELTEEGVWTYAPEHLWRCRVALNSGDALMGALGRDSYREFTVLGDTINVAFRLESIGGTHGYELVMGESTARLVQDSVPVVLAATFTLEGHANPIAFYTLSPTDP